mmetsp:Transcript_15976/g.34738  ORF Transcript_15976/g.34738 Transcript_15976/m.34738 type:complete len:138 (+) Transcript_15976:413-826(+)
MMLSRPKPISATLPALAPAQMETPASTMLYISVPATRKRAIRFQFRVGCCRCSGAVMEADNEAAFARRKHGKGRSTGGDSGCLYAALPRFLCGFREPHCKEGVELGKGMSCGYLSGRHNMAPFGLIVRLKIIKIGSK